MRLKMCESEDWASVSRGREKKARVDACIASIDKSFDGLELV